MDGTKLNTIANQKQARFNELGNELIDIGLGVSKGQYCEGCIALTIKGLEAMILKLKKLKSQEEKKT